MELGKIPFTEEPDPLYFEQPPALKVGVTIRGLRKEFGSKKAVNGVDLDLYFGQITVLLGHNGAGKTTTMSCLTGIYKPTAGKIIIDGFDMTESRAEARKRISLCLQHDSLYDHMTIEEHLLFYGHICGIPPVGLPLSVL